MQFNDAENGEGMMIGYLRMGGIFNFVAKALDPNKNYKVWDADNEDYVRVMSGKELMTDGFVVARDINVSSAVVLWYEETDAEISPFDRDKYLEGKIDYVRLDPLTNDEAKLIELAKDIELGSLGVEFVMSDYNSSGGIYLIGKDVYDGFKLTSEKTADGWSIIDRSNSYIKFEGDDSYPMNHASWERTFDLRAYIKKIDEMCFLWLDNSFSFGDMDGSWQTGPRILVLKRGNKTVESESFTFYVAQCDVYSGVRDIQFIFTSENGSTVYKLKEDFYMKLSLSDNKISDFGCEWTEINMPSTFFKIALDPLVHSEDNEGCYKTININDLKSTCGVTFCVTEKDGEYYMMIKNASKLSSISVSDRWLWTNLDKDMHFESMFYIEIPGSYRAGTSKTENVVDPW